MNKEILELTKIGFEFEFITELSNNDLKNKLEKLFDKKFIITDQYHSDIKVTDRQFKIEPDYSVGITGREIITGPLRYYEAMEVLEKMSSFIRRFGKTDTKTAFQPNISFEKEVFTSLKHSFNPLKFILEFDEEYIYERFPERRNNLYAKSIKRLKPVSNLFNVSESGFNSKIITYPDSKYYGVNFEKLRSDYLEVRYLGGSFYEYKLEELKESIDYSIQKIYESSVVNENKLSDDNMLAIKEVVHKYNNLRSNVSSVKNLKEAYPNIKFYTDLERDKKVIDNKLFLLRDKMTDLFFNNDLKEGIINYDSEKGRFQLKNFELDSCEFEGVDFLNCKISNTIITGNAEIHMSEIKNCDITECKLYRNKIKNTRVKNSYTNSKNILEKCYVDGPMTKFNGILKSGIFRKGTILKDAQFSTDNTEIIEYNRF